MRYFLASLTKCSSKKFHYFSSFIQQKFQLQTKNIDFAESILQKRKCQNSESKRIHNLCLLLYLRLYKLFVLRLIFRRKTQVIMMIYFSLAVTSVFPVPSVFCIARPQVFYYVPSNSVELWYFLLKQRNIRNFFPERVL